MAKIIVNLNELKGTSFYRNYIEKAKKGEMVGGKYMYREEVPEKVKTSKGKTTVIRYKYYYLADMLKDSAEKLLENIGKFFFKGNEKEVKKIENSYKTQNIEKDYGADKKTWYQHCMEYLSHKAKWDKRFSNKDNAEKFKTPIKQKVAEKVDIPGMETAAEETPEIKTTIETEKKEATWKPNPSLMRKVWSLYNGVESVNNGVNVGDTVNFNGRKGTVTKKVNDNMVMVSFEDGGLGRFFAKDLNKVEISNESVTNEADVNGKIQEVVTGLNTSNDTVEETKENLTNIFNSTNNGVAKQLREKFNSITNAYLGTKFVNKKTGIQAEFSTTSQKELRSRLENSKRNGFTIQEHFELANKIKELFENASLEKKHKDNKNNDENVNIERFLSEPVVLSTGKKVQACITVKHILNKDGHYVYSLETMDIKNALEKTRAKGGDHIGDSPNTYNNTTNIENVNSEHGNKIAMLGNQNAKKNFVDFIDKFITNGYKSDKVVNLLDTTPSILQEHGIPNNPISITPSVLKKILENDLNVYHGHNISIDILKDLPNQLENPVYILKGKDGKKIIVTEYYVENRPIITILEIDRKEGRTNVNSVRSLYDKQNDVFMEWIKDDSIVEYENKEKSKVLLQSIGNQYTKEVTTPYINNNTTNIENVNSEHGNKIAMLGNDNAKKQFSDLTQEEKQQKKEQIQNNIVSSIQKDSVLYNNDGFFDKAAKTWLEKNNVGNAETVIGEVIINRKSVERDMHHGDLADKYLKLQTLPAVKDVLEKGTYLGYERDFKGKNISNHYFAAKINYGNEEKIVFCRVRETDGSEERFYVHEVFTEDEIKKGTNLVPTVGRLPQLTGKLLYNFILQEVLNVNSEHGNSTVMLGNDNAHKDFADIEDDKQEFNYLISRYNELTKEFSSNGGYSNKRTTKEQDEKRRAAQRGLREIEKDLNDFREKVKEKNKGSFKIPEVYKDSLNEWIKRKVKGQTVSDEWLSKKFGGYYSDALSFGDDYLLSLGDTENINNPSVRINYKDNFGYTRYVSVDIADIDKDQYRPRFMPNDDTNFTEVWKKIQTLKEQLDNTTGSTMAEKFFNLSMGISNAYNENSKTPNIPRYRFTKDGIKDKNGKLEKINASVRDVGTENEHIQLYADSYGTSIPSIFYPENNTDTQTDYFEKDSCAVFPDHPYYNHLKIMALKARLYRGRATKWNAMTKEEQSKVEEQIKNLENQLVEPTEEDLKAYREKRDKQEEIKAKEKEERLAKYYKEKEEKEKRDLERYNKVVNLMRTDIGSFLEKDAKYKLENKTYTNIGLSENKTPILISVEDGERIEFDSLEEYVQLLLNGELEKVSDIEEYNNRSQAMMGNDNAARFRIVHPKEVVEKETVEVNDVEHTNDTNQNNNELVVPIPTVDTKTVERINENSMLGNAGNVYQHDVRVEMENFKNKFNYNNMNPQQKAYFKERVADYSSLVGSSYNEMASKRLSAGPSWVVAGPAKYNTKRFQQKTDSERRAYETFSEKKEKFIKNTEKKLKELEYSGGTESVEDVKQKVFDDYSQGKYSYGEKIENTDPYAIEKIKGKIKYMEDAHDVTLIYNKMCKKNGITNWQWTDRTDEDKAKRKEVLKQTIEEAKGKGYSDKVIKQGIEHPFGSNQTADIRRNKQRLEELEKRQQKLEERKVAESNSESVSNANIGRVDFDGGYIYENPELDRIQIIYDGKPERDVIDKLKHNGFRWSPSNKAWQRQLNRNGRMAVNRVLEETGINTKIDIDGAGEVKKSLPLFFIKDGRFYIRKS